MLRISKVAQGDSIVTLKLEGRIVFDWVAILYGEILKFVHEGKKVVLDFSEVRYVDELGIRMLRQQEEKNVQIINCPAFIEDLLKGGNE
jgi:anti-anti-sigma regulatory factor